MNYEDFCDPDEVAIYRKVKRQTMRLGAVARSVACALVGGEIEDVGHEYVRTPIGRYRLAMAANSDNTTERAAHDEAGVEIVVMGDPAAMVAWFTLHGRDVPYHTFANTIRRAL